MTWESEDFDDLAAELRRRVASEFRSEAEEVERLVHLQRKRKAILRDIVTSAMHQGQGVTLRSDGREWTGELLGVGTDYLSLKTATHLVDARLGSIAMSFTPARQGGRTGKLASATFKARLTELEMVGEEVTLRSIPIGEISGLIEVVATDHVEMKLPTERCYLPLDSVVMVIRPLPE